MQKKNYNAQDLLGNAIPNAAASVYLKGTSTLATIYSDNGITPATNPLTTDANGMFSFYVADGRYDIQAVKAGYTTQNWKDELFFDPNASTGSAYVSFVQSGIGAGPRTLQAKEREIVSITDFYANGVSGAMVDPTGVIDSTAGIQAAIDSMFDASTGFYHGWVHSPKGRYKVGTTNPIKIRDNTRGFGFTGDGSRATVFVNANTSGGSAMTVGVVGGVGCYDLALRDFKIEGNGLYTDGIGLDAGQKVLNSHFENIFVEFTGSHAFRFDTCWDNGFYTLKARRAGFGAGGLGIANVAGFYLKTNVTGAFVNCLADTCAEGVIVDNCRAKFIHLDTEYSVLHGMKVINGGAVTCTTCYSEGNVGTNDWLIGDGGVTNSPFGIFEGCEFGAGSRVIFNKTLLGDFDNCKFLDTNSNQIQVTDSTVTTVRVGPSYQEGVYNAGSANKIAQLQFSQPPATSRTNLLRNGSFEHGSLDAFWLSTPDGWNNHWTGAAGAVSNTLVAASGHDTGSKAVQSSITVATSTYQWTPTSAALPVTTSGKVYTIEFSYKNNTTSAVTFTLGTNGVQHANYTLPVASTWTRVAFQFQALGAITSLQWNITAVAILALDAIMLYEGTELLAPQFATDAPELEHFTFRNILAATTNRIIAAQQTYTNQSLLTGGTVQPDYPRNITITASAAAAAGSLTITGQDWRGQEITETLTVTVGGTTTGSKMFLRTIRATGYDAGAAQTLSIGTGTTLGLPKKAIALLKVMKNQVDAQPSFSYAFDATNNGVQMGSMGGIAAGDDVTVWYLK